ncbi:MAG TPA: RDD family protein [Myxococcaceae bacterium]|nr:RDD family protein [Myxococcaceae bacterium]
MGVVPRAEPAPDPAPSSPVAPPRPTVPAATMAELMGPRGTAPTSDQTPHREPRAEKSEPVISAPWTGGTAADGVIEVRARPAALWQRITAFLVDGALVGGVLALYVGLAAALITPRGVSSSQLTGIDGVMARVHQLNAVLAPCVALALVLGLVYAAAFALLWNGRTPGRRLLGIRLVDRTGLAPTPGRAITRAALAVVSFIPFLAGFWLALFDRRGQTLHDKLTQTFVVRPG